jgi:hypothetical protein
VGLPFQRKQTVTVVTENGRELTSNYILFHLKRFKTWPMTLVPMAELESWLASRDHPVYLMARQHKRDLLASVAGNRGAALNELTMDYCGVLLPAPKDR